MKKPKKKFRELKKRKTVKREELTYEKRKYIHKFQQLVTERVFAIDTFALKVNLKL